MWLGGCAGGCRDGRDVLSGAGGEVRHDGLRGEGRGREDRAWGRWGELAGVVGGSSEILGLLGACEWRGVQGGRLLVVKGLL